MTVKTSATHPIRVDWLPTPWLGRVGLTFAPGKKQPDAATGAWERDLGADVQRLRNEFEAGHIVCLLTDAELVALGVEALPEAVEAAGMSFQRLPISDGGLPPDDAALHELVAEIALLAAQGGSVVIHCKGGLGRAGTVGGCVLRHAGLTGDESLSALAAARGPSCPETAAQRRFIRDYVPGAPVHPSRVAGAVLAAAIGDALGHPTEFMDMAGIHAKYSPSGVAGFELWWERDGHRFAPYTDDTQMAEIVIRALVDPGPGAGMDAVMGTIAAGFVAWAKDPQGGHRAPGNACMAGTRALAAGVEWRESGGADAGGCGSVMRAYPFGILFAHDPDDAIRWAAEHSKMTHRAPIALAACAGLAAGIAHEFAASPGEAVRSAVVEAAGRYDAGTAEMVQRAIDDAAAGANPEHVLARLQGWAAHEALAAAMFVVTRHPANLRAALVEAANTPGDSDSIATLAGALLGARLGLEALPSDWVRDVERSRELLALADAAAAVS